MATAHLDKVIIESIFSSQEIDIRFQATIRDVALAAIRVSKFSEFVNYLLLNAPYHYDAIVFVKTPGGEVELGLAHQILWVMAEMSWNRSSALEVTCDALVQYAYFMQREFVWIADGMHILELTEAESDWFRFRALRRLTEIRS